MKMMKWLVQGGIHLSGDSGDLPLWGPSLVPPWSGDPLRSGDTPSEDTPNWGPLVLGPPGLETLCLGPPVLGPRLGPPPSWAPPGLPRSRNPPKSWDPPSLGMDLQTKDTIYFNAFPISRKIMQKILDNKT